MTNIFIDSAAFKAVFDEKDDFHYCAWDYWNKIATTSYKLITTNYILDESLTLFRAYLGKQYALNLYKNIFDHNDKILLEHISRADEAEAWSYFEKLPGRGVSFTDCTSFAVMKRLSLKQAFTFDKDFEKAGFDVVPL